MIVGMTVIVLVGMPGLFGKLGKSASERGIRIFDQSNTFSDLFGCDRDALGLEGFSDLLVTFQVVEVMINPVFQPDSTFLDIIHGFSTFLMIDQTQRETEPHFFALATIRKKLASIRFPSGTASPTRLFASQPLSG